MTLGFTTHFPDGTPTLFPEKILLPFWPEIGEQYPGLRPKLHTFRQGRRWRAGMRMHMVTGNRTAARRQFNLGIPQLAVCTAVQDCVITFVKEPVWGMLVEVESGLLSPEQTVTLFHNDGFADLDQAWNFFEPRFRYTYINERITGQIIHFSTLLYHADPKI